MKPIYIIEHLEPELGQWCMFEYERISQLVGKENLWFTNVKEQSTELHALGTVKKESVKTLNLPRACVLDPEASELLTPENVKPYQYIIIGGILGDYPPKKRTTKELTQFVPHAHPYHIGKKQFSTDNAVYIVDRIVKGTPFESIKTQYKISIPVDDIASIDLPYCYPLDTHGTPLMSPKLLHYLKTKEGF
jgi:ribosome biogenesis SPOUT family RNA methylase Rps3